MEMKKYFDINQRPTKEQRKKMSETLEEDYNKITRWFQNKRQRSSQKLS